MPRALLKPAVLVHSLLSALTLGVTASAEEDAPLVERVEILRNQYLQTETLLYYVSTKPGDRYDELILREDFRRLWDTDFLDDLLLDVRDGEKGKIVTFVVRERRRIQIVDYRGSKALTTSNIEDKLKEKDALIRIDTFYDPGKAKRVEEVILQALKEKGLTFASVKHETKSVGAAGLQLSFILDDGPKTKVKEISFSGNEVFSDGKLRGAIKKIKESGFFNWTWLNGKNKYSEEKWVEGQEKLRDFYLNHGYVQASVGQPRLRYIDGKSGLFKKKPVKWLHLDVPVTEGDQYSVGDVKFEGLTVFKEEAVRDLFKLKTGDVYNDSKLKHGYDKLRDIYGSVGYFQMTGFTKRTPDPQRKVVHLVLSMEEDKKYYVGKIRFTGNETTRDKVIRREIYLNEAEVFNTEALKLTLRRINQLGYFKPMEAPPEITQTPGKDDHLDLTFKVEEQNRNQFTFGGGVSGLEGAFINASFATSNFLGLGETVSVAAQTGSRSSTYQLGISEPYFLDRPVTVGANLFSRKLDYLGTDGRVAYSEVRTGAGVTAGRPVGRFTRAYANYTYEVIDTAVRDDLASQTSASLAVGAPILDAAGVDGRNWESRFSPSIVHNTVDNPFAPRSGLRLTGAFPVAGGPLGGTVDYFKTDLEAVVYVPHTRLTALGLRGAVGWIRAFGDTETVPYYQRFFLGGETQIRGVNARSVGPIDAQNRAIGGDKFLLFNAEYYVDIAGPLRFLLFFDAGEAYPEGQGFYWKTMRTSTGAELRMLMPVLNVPFRLIYAYNANRDTFQPATAFKFAVGTTF